MYNASLDWFYMQFGNPLSCKVDEFIKAADKLMCSVKNSGKNLIRLEVLDKSRVLLYEHGIRKGLRIFFKVI